MTDYPTLRIVLSLHVILLNVKAITGKVYSVTLLFQCLICVLISNKFSGQGVIMVFSQVFLSIQVFILLEKLS